MILTIIRVHRISYIRPVRPDKKKQTRTRDFSLRITVFNPFSLDFAVTRY
jgi:hypothetical protein